MKLPAAINAIKTSLINRKRKLENDGLTSEQIEQDDVVTQYREAMEILEHCKHD